MASFNFSRIWLMLDWYVFVIPMKVKWWENKKSERKESLVYFFHSGFFSLFALSLSCFSPQWLCLTSSPRNLQKPTELVHYDICLNCLPGWQIEKKNPLCSLSFCPAFTSRHVHQPVFFFFSSFSTLNVLLVSTALPSLFLPLWDIWTAVAECVYYRGCDPDILFNTWPLSA